MKLWVTIALFALLTLTGLRANAQMSEGERKAAARAAFLEGVALQEGGNPAEALTRFEAAQKLFDAPTHLLRIAECQALTGKLVEASETYETLARTPLEEDAPEAFVHAQERGRAELQQLRQRVPTMRISMTPEPRSLEGLAIVVNGKQMPTELIGIARPVNPGAYAVTATATGWATLAPVEVEIKEREPTNVALVLERTSSGAVVPPGTPPPYEGPQPKESPSAAGLLLGLRPGFMAPAGDVEKNRKFDTFASSGGGVGLDVIGRVARLFLVGGTVELGSLGAPDASTLPSGVSAEIATRTVYAGALVGIMPNVDRVTFVADAGAGLRSLSQTRTVATPGGATKIEESYRGLELAVNAGLSIPAGPFRVVPKAGLAFGQFSSRDCSLHSSVAVPGCHGGVSVDSASHTMVLLSLGLYYHLDFGKKKPPARPR